MSNPKEILYMIIICIFMYIMPDMQAHEKIDSLQKKLSSEKNDTARLKLLNEIVWELINTDPAQAIQLTDSIITVAKEQNQQSSLASAYYNLGIIYANAGDHKSAFEWIIKGNNISHDIGDSTGIANAMKVFGLVYWMQNRLNKSLEYITLSKELFERLNQTEYLVHSYNDLGLLYREKGEFKKAIENFELAIVNLDSIDNNMLRIKVRLNLAETYIDINMKKEALKEIEQGEKICNTYGSLSEFCELYLLKGKYFEHIKKRKKAEKLYFKALSISDLIKNYRLKSKVLDQLRQFYTINKNFKKAFQYQGEYYHLKDSLNKFQNLLLLSRLDIKNEFDEKLDQQTRFSKIKDEIKQNEIDYQKRIRNFLIIGLFIFFTLGIISFFNYRQKLKNAKILASQRQEILLKTEILREQMEEDRMKTELIEFINEENEILSLIAKETDNTVFLITPEGNIEWVNEAFSRLSGYSFEEFKRRRGSNIFKASSSESIQEYFMKCLETKKPVTYVSKTEDRDQKSIWIHTTLTPVLNDDNDVTRLIAIDADITKIKEAEEQIAIKNMEITWSLQYARKIQKALLPRNIYMSSLFPQHFVINLPQNIVSGDFYWIANKKQQTLVVVADSTGHGVPGAFMSVLGISTLQDIVSKMDFLEPTKILELLREKIVYLLHYQNSEYTAADTLDIALCVIDNENLMLNYAGSNNPAFIIRDDVLVELKPDKYFMWDSFSNNSFTLKTFQLMPEDRIYMFTDGFSDQFGGDSDKKYSRRRLKKLLLEIYTLPMDTQKDLLSMDLKNWQGKNEQIDDILVLAFQV